MVSKETLQEMFEKKWESISGNFPENTRDEIKKETKNIIGSIGRCKTSKIKENYGIIATALCEAQKTVILRKIVKPKTQKEIADMFHISSATITNRRARG